ncbi:MAG: D-alanine--D-alanine ligase [Bacteroidota bacterium]|nr:D-alanine--D-alanine ligase [Bacteroidota bacterium]
MRTIAIAAGGDSSEFEISVKSAQEVEKALYGRYQVYIIMIRETNWYWEDNKGRYHNIDKNDFTLVLDDQRIRFDAVFIAIHGTPGENGLLQGYFDIVKIPFTSCGVFCSALTFNKQACKLYLKEYAVPMAGNILIRRGERTDESLILKKIGLPCFVKPNDSGSSFGVSKVRVKVELHSAIEKALKESDEVMIESFMQGREVACGVVKVKGKSFVLPVTEIISKNDFFDFEAKYTPGKSDEVTPANMPEKITSEIQDLSSRIYDLLGCKGIVRVDFIVIDEKPHFLEINTVPGMTAESIIPKQAEAAGIVIGELYSMVIEDLFEGTKSVTM